MKFGDRILQLLGESGLSQTEAAERAHMPLRTLQRWTTLDRAPRSAKARSRIKTLESPGVLNGPIMGEGGAADVIQIRDVPARIPPDFKKRAQAHIARAREIVGRVLGMMEQGKADTGALSQALDHADQELGLAERELNKRP